MLGLAELSDFDMMFVHPAHQHVGVATLLLATVEAAATAQELNRLCTEASLTARPFIEKRGFMVLTAQRVEKRGQLFTSFRMEKALPYAHSVRGQFLKRDDTPFLLDRNEAAWRRHHRDTWHRHPQ